MRISYRVDHGVRVMTRLEQLSAADPGRPVIRARLAQRGGGGGWLLARPAGTITVADVIRALEGPLSVVRGVRPHELLAEGDPEPFVSLWIAVRAALRSVLETVTIADLAAGELPPRVAALAADPDAWDAHGTAR